MAGSKTRRRGHGEDAIYFDTAKIRCGGKDLEFRDTLAAAAEVAAA